MIPANARRLTRRAVAGLFVVVLAMAAWVVWAPRNVLAVALAVVRVHDGFAVGHVVTADGEVPYLVGGHGPVVVLLHGFQDSKESWLGVAARLTTRYRVVIPDLTGFGANHATSNGDYRPMAQARRVRSFLEALHIGTANVGGVSMGGEIAAAFAAQYPAMTVTLALVSTAGASSDTLAPVGQRLATGENVFHVERIGQLDTLIDRIADSGMTIPWVAKRAILAEYRERNVQWDSIFAQWIEPSTRTLVDSLASTLAVPTLLLWGRVDPIFHRSTATRLLPRLVRGELTIFTDCGHLCPASHPAEVARRYLQFLNGHNGEAGAVQGSGILSRTRMRIAASGTTR